MTSIWDRLGQETYKLQEQKNWDEQRAKKARDCMRAVYNAIKNRAEYQALTIPFRKNTLLTQLSTWTEPESKLTPEMMTKLNECISTLHEFDHLDLPTEYGKSYGHHTENIIQRKRSNGESRKALANIHTETWWNGSLERWRRLA